MGYREDVPPSFKVKIMPHLQNGNMSQRHHMSKKHSKKSFTKHAVHKSSKNFVSGVMRGGIRF